MRKISIDAYLFIIIIAILGLVNLINPNKPKVSELENRMLQEKPEMTVASIFTGDYFNDYEAYYKDTFIAREEMVKLSQDLKSALTLFESDVKLVAIKTQPQVEKGYDERVLADKKEEKLDSKDSVDSNIKAKPDLEEKDIEDSIDDKDVDKNKDRENATDTIDEKEEDNIKENEKEEYAKQEVGYWLVVDGKAVELFRFNKDNITRYANVLNDFKVKLPSEVNIYSLIPPTAGEFLKLKEFASMTDSQNEAIEYMNSCIEDGIVPVDAYSALQKHKDEYIYFRTDHHWTALGAYYGYRAFMESKNEEPIELERYKKTELDGFLGSSYSQTLSKDLEKNPDKVYIYHPFNEYEYEMYYEKTYIRYPEIIDMSFADSKRGMYSIFMSTGGATLHTIKTDVSNGEKILVIKDSFGNILTPFLLSHYEEIYVVDARFYVENVIGMDLVELVEEKKIDDVLFCFYMDNINQSSFIEKLSSHMGD